MPPRRSARVAAAVERVSSALSPLPHAVVLDIFARLPADERARAKLVSRGWLSMMSDVCLWTRLDLSPTSGVRVHVTDAVLRAAAGFARRAGGLTALDVSGCNEIKHAALLAVVKANAGSLRELRICGPCAWLSRLGIGDVDRLIRAAPLLSVFDATLSSVGYNVDVLAVLRNEPHWGALRVHALLVNYNDSLPAARTASVLELAAGIVGAAHASLSTLALLYAPLDSPATLDAVVDAVLARRIRKLQLTACELPHFAAPAFVRLLRGEVLTELDASPHEDQPVPDTPALALLCDALRENSTLTSLSLWGTTHVFNSPQAATALMSALTGHPCLRALLLGCGPLDGQAAAAAGAAFGALVAANAPALRKLSLNGFYLDDASMRPLVLALPQNTHLRELSVRLQIGNMSEAFARDELLPAVRANTSLRSLACYGGLGAEAQAHVAARAAADAGGAQ
jgi:hypothetical protein